MAKRRNDSRQLPLLHVETDPSRVGTIRTGNVSRYSAGNPASRLKSVEVVRRALPSIPSASAALLLAVLLEARKALSESGWVRGQYLVDSGLAPRARKADDGYTLVDALGCAPVSAARWEARLLLQRIAGHPNLVEWNCHPYRQARDVEQLLDNAIHELGGRSPGTRIREWGPRVHRGGWSVTTKKGSP